MFRFNAFLILYIGTYLSVFSQNIDSVLSANAELSPVKKVKLLDDLAWDHMYINYEHAYTYGFAANQIALENDLKKSAATTYNTLGVVRRRQSLFEESKIYYRKADKIWEELGITRQKLNIYQNLANVVRAQGYNDSAIYYSNLGLDLAIEMNDSAKISVALLGLGTTYKNMGWNETAIDYYTQGAVIDQILGDTVGMGIYWSNIGDVMFSLKDYNEALYYHKETLKLDEYDNNKLNQAITWKAIGMNFQRLDNYDSAAISYGTALALAKEVGDELLVGEINICRGELLQETSRVELAIDIFSDALGIAKSFDDPLLEASAYLGLGEAYLKNNMVNQAVLNLRRANDLARKIQFGQVHIESHKLLAEAFNKQGESQQAFEHLRQFLVMKDSLNNASTQARIAELENVYELSNKDHQIELQASVISAAAIKSQRDRLITIAIVLGLLITIALLIFIQKRKKYKTQIIYEAEKNRLKQEQIRAVISSQEKERKRFAMDLHDDFGQLISALKLNVQSNSQDEKSEKILDTMYSSLKNIAFDLMPHTLFEKGLEEAVEELKHQIDGDALILDVQVYGTKGKIDGDQKIAVYRIIQEIVSNIIKYAKASKINISLTDNGNGLTVLIEDDGIGFNPEEFKAGKGNGWKNIKSRLDLLNAEISFDSIEGRKSSTVIVEIPYTQSAIGVA